MRQGGKGGMWQENKLRSSEKHPHSRSAHQQIHTCPGFDCNQNGPCRRGLGGTTTAGKGDNSLHFLSCGGGGASVLWRHATRSVQGAGPIEKTDDCLGVGCEIDLALPCLRKRVVSPYRIQTAGRPRMLDKRVSHDSPARLSPNLFSQDPPPPLLMFNVAFRLLTRLVSPTV